MEGDNTRNSDEEAKSYSGVLMQQGRVQLDADWNEQWAIQTRALRSAFVDLVGRHGGPRGRAGYHVRGPADPAFDPKVLLVEGGVYYVDGIRCELRDPFTVRFEAATKGWLLAVLEVWERHVNAIEDEAIREVALLGADTATRAQVLSRVRLLPWINQDPTFEGDAELADEYVDRVLRQPRRPGLAARVRPEAPSDDPCALDPESRFRGRENQLYRVQIHDVPAREGKPLPNPVLFTFKWSRDNGSVVFPVVSITGPAQPERAVAGDGSVTVVVELAHFGRDERSGLQAGDIVEFVNDHLTVGDPDNDPVTLDDNGADRATRAPLGRVLDLLPETRTVTVAVFSGDVMDLAEGTLHPYLRRWDHRETPAGAGRVGARRETSAAGPLVAGAIPVRRSDLERWIALEDGVEVKFERVASGPDVPDPPPPPPPPPPSGGTPGGSIAAPNDLSPERTKPSSKKGTKPAPPKPSRDLSPEKVAPAPAPPPATRVGGAAEIPAGPLRLRPGDYWQIPARVATGDLLWPRSGGDPLTVPPHGVTRHFAPLALLLFNDQQLDQVIGVRRLFTPLASDEING